MKNLKQILLIAIALVTIGFSDVKAQETVLIRTFETYGKTAKMIVTSSNGHSLETPLGPLGKGHENLEGNNKIILEEIQRWKMNGYKLVGVANGGDGIGVTTNTFILEK